MTSDLAEERQRAVAIYFIDKLALRVGNEKVCQCYIMVL